MRRAFKFYFSSAGYILDQPENKGDTVWRGSMPTFQRFQASFNNIQDELAAGIPAGTVSAQAFLGQIYQFNTGQYDGFVNGDGPSNEKERAEKASGTLTNQGHLGVGVQKQDLSGAAQLITNYITLVNSLLKVFSGRSNVDRRTTEFLKQQLAFVLTAKLSITDSLRQIREFLP